MRIPAQFAFRFGCRSGRNHQSSPIIARSLGRFLLARVTLLAVGMLVAPAIAFADNLPPTIDSTPPSPATEDTPYTYSATRSDPDGPGATWSLTAMHGCGGSIGASTGVFTFTPTGPVPAASCTLSVRVCDGGTPDECATQTTTLTITPVNDPPTIDSTPPSTAIEDTPYTYNATRNDPDGPGATWSLTAMHGCGGSIGAGSGVFTFTPTGPVPAASCTLSVRVCDGGTPDQCATQTTTLTITPVNDPPTIDSTPPSTATEDTPYSYSATRNDPDGPGATWNLTAMNGCFGSIGAGSGVFTFTPTGPVPAASCTLSVRVCDGGTPNQCATQTTTLTITPVNDPPTIDSTPPSTATEDTAYTYNATRNDPDGPGQTWSFTGAHTCGGSIGAATGVFTFTPTGPTPPPSCVVGLQVCDGGTPSLCATQNTTITINDVTPSEPTPTSTLGGPSPTPTPTSTLGGPTPSGTPVPPDPTATPTPAAASLCAGGPFICKAAGVTAFTLRNDANDRRDHGTFSWKRGDATSQGELGNPAVDTQYTVCVWDDVAGTPTLVMEMVAPPAGNCVGRPCWRLIGRRQRVPLPRSRTAAERIAATDHPIRPAREGSALRQGAGHRAARSADAVPTRPVDHGAGGEQPRDLLGADYVNPPQSNTATKLIAKEKP